MSKVDSLMTIMQLKDFLNISRSKAYEIVKRNDKKKKKIGKCIRINKEELLRWLHNPKNVI